jgi:hypothetical protein
MKADSAQPTLQTAVVLFGSRARGDASPDSDVDLLIWTAEEFPRHSCIGSLSLSFYPRRQLLQKARVGDLFIGHLVHEAVVIHDPFGLLLELRNAYRVSPNLRADIVNAADLGYMILDHNFQFDDVVLNRRIGWVTRTILIARAIESGQHVYAAGQLATMFKEPNALTLIAAKDEKTIQDDKFELFRQFLSKWSGRNRPLGWYPLSYYERLFLSTGNTFGSKTLKLAHVSEEWAMYS